MAAQAHKMCASAVIYTAYIILPKSTQPLHSTVAHTIYTHTFFPINPLPISFIFERLA